MIYFLALIPATALTLAGYVVLVLSARTEGALRSFGRYLGFWAFTLAALMIVGAILAAAHGGHHGFGRHGMQCPWAEAPRGEGPAGPPPGPPAAPAEPAPAPPR
ncbi:MAG TPA: hypothetical protein VET66_03085 [Steroidobacteraceae bacterium]|nr:hypothetical protein [Steroidobacteraceae bacterium]